MTRQIKFRIWDGKYMFEPSSISWKDGVMWACDKHGTNRFEYELLRPITGLMQFTGLKDKNGKEIYEGDIVKGVVKFPQLLTGDTDENCNFKMAGSVFYDDTSFELKVIQSMCDEDRDGMVNYFSFIGIGGEIFDEKEIIGNIYENPELIK